MQSLSYIDSYLHLLVEKGGNVRKYWKILDIGLQKPLKLNKINGYPVVAIREGCRDAIDRYWYWSRFR